MAKGKTNKKRSASSSSSSSHSNRSVGTRQMSNVSPHASSSSAISSGNGDSRGRGKTQRNSQRTPVRRVQNSSPVDLDEMADNLNERNIHSGAMQAISPADTFDTVPLSESPSAQSSSSFHGRHENREYIPVSLLNFDSPRNGVGNRNGNQNDRVVIEHKIHDGKKHRTSASRSVPFLMLWLKPLLFILLLIALGSGAASVYGWLFKFPSLNEQVAALEEEVARLTDEIDRLETQVNRLEGENDRYQYLNDQLNGTVNALEDVRDDLNGTVIDLSETAMFLNNTKDQLAQKVEELSRQNQDYALLNQGLEANVQQLAGEVAFFEEALDGLTLEHSILKNTTEALRELAYEFSNNSTIYTNETLQVLKATLEDFVSENDRLESLNADLERGLTYLNQTLLQNGNLVQSSTATLEEIASFLGDQVEQQQRSTLTQLEIAYRQLVTGWDCDFYDVFDESTLLAPGDSSEQLSQAVISYINDRVLVKLCLDTNDFLSYLSLMTESALTFDQLVRAMLLYTEEAMKFYFSFSTDTSSDISNEISNADQIGISLSDWIGASFRCELLPGSPFSLHRDKNINVRKRALLNE